MPKNQDIYGTYNTAFCFRMEQQSFQDAVQSLHALLQELAEAVKGPIMQETVEAAAPQVWAQARKAAEAATSFMQQLPKEATPQKELLPWKEQLQAETPILQMILVFPFPFQ